MTSAVAAATASAAITEENEQRPGLQQRAQPSTKSVFPTTSAPTSTTTTTQAPPRKRRRRTTTRGATDDCFACQNRQIACDRKRPYCTQCLEIGKECSGYKTALTWGVGVASRGKLRGLACPVTNKSMLGLEGNPEGMETRRRKSSVSSVKVKLEDENAGGSALSHGAPKFGAITAPMAMPPPRQVHTSPYGHGISQSLPILRQQPEFQSLMDSRQERPPLQPLQTSLAPGYDNQSMPDSARSVTSFAASEFSNPSEFVQTPASATFSDPMHIHNSYADVASSGTDFAVCGDPIDLYGAPSRSGSLDVSFPHGAIEVEADAFGHELPMSSEGSFEPIQDLYFSVPPHWETRAHDEEQPVRTKHLALSDARFASPFFHLSPRLQSLLKHYDMHICPYLVAFDGPNNPYRKHILQLAAANEGLQNAIAALAVNNVRMRKKDTSVIEHGEGSQDLPLGMVKDHRIYEEQCFKQMAIDQLNYQLTSSAAAQDDSVLGTLLILCLFHVCDSGFSKFKTQLAGVQKLLNLRDAHRRANEFTSWVEMFFTWFDVMTSTVNDREVQIQPPGNSSRTWETGIGSLEQFSGCDGHLFGLIARLGRLNLLAQGRAVRGVPAVPAKPPTSPAPADNSQPDYSNLDGNGWRAPLPPPPTPPQEKPTDRPAFWREWHAVHHALTTHTTPTPSDPSQSPHPDLLAINALFRHACHLYTYRLALPSLPATHTPFAGLVAAALGILASIPIESPVNKFLLWPLFIVGTETVEAGGRALVRERCVEVQRESGFWNNLAGLGVLERWWEEVDRGAGADGAEWEKGVGGVGPLGWRRAMRRVDGEYIVI